MTALLSRLDSWSHALERRVGILATGLLWSLLLLLVAALWVTAEIRPVSQGNDYAALSEVPFRFAEPNLVRTRILSPAIGFLVFLRGQAFILLPWAAGVAFLVILYAQSRWRDHRPSESIGFAALMAFSTPILFALRFPGYVDTVSYLLILGCLLTIRQPLWWGSLFAIAMLNHESNLFALPYLLAFGFLRNRRPRHVAGQIATGLAALLPWAAYRWFLAQHLTVEFSTGFYLSPDNIARNLRRIALHAPWGIFMGFKLFWFFPIAAAVMAWQRRDRPRVGWYALVVLCTLGQLVIASDTSRLMGLAFPAILIGAVDLHRQWGSERFVRFLWFLVLLNLLVPQYYVAQNGAHPWVPLPLTMILVQLGIPV